MKYFAIVISLVFVQLGLQAQSNFTKADSSYIVNNYSKQEVLISMRDGIKLFTSIYTPKDGKTTHPILLTRTPYSCAPYGAEAFRALWTTNYAFYTKLGYIIVMQDVRGRYMSEGEFEDVRPINPKKKRKETDEASDTYDSIDWLVKNLKNNNGNVGVFGISYPGFYSSTAALSNHPALKAVSPQAPVTDWFMGDDFHHNGAFMLIDAFNFYKGFGVPRPLPTTKYNSGYQLTEENKYNFYLNSGALPTFTTTYLGDSIKFWNNMMQHGNYDAFWQARNIRTHLKNIKPAMLVVGGLFDAEDCYGAWNVYKSLEVQNPANNFNKIVMGPWFHGAWGGRSTGENLGKVKFGAETSTWYQQQVEVPFFESHLNNKKATKELAEATVFVTGENSWHNYSSWPPVDNLTPIYLQPKGQLSFSLNATPTTKDTTLNYTAYISDPSNPVPHEGGTIVNRTREYMTADQRFASARPDVITFSTPKLTEKLTLTGAVEVELYITTTGTDADFIVKIIDVFPEDIANQPGSLYAGEAEMNGYQMLVRGEVMRGKFYKSFEKPEALQANTVTKIAFTMPDMAHSLLPGHQLMIQIQSSWFPLVDRNPQVFTDIYNAKESDFKKARIAIYHSQQYPSNIKLPVVK